MLAKSIVSYFFFGTVVRYIQDAREGYPIHGEALILGNLDRIFKFLNDLDLQVTRRAARELEQFTKELRDADQNAKLSKEGSKRLNDLMSDLRKTLVAEMAGFEAYVVTPKRLDAKRLLNDVPSLLAPRLFDRLPAVAQHDLIEAGKCVAFERATAAAFHLLRGTESVLRHYYCRKIKRNRVPLMWGNITQDMRQKQKTKHNTVLINNLDNIRLSFRNPTQHPEKNYDIQEVQDLWGLCIDAINRMMQDIE